MIICGLLAAELAEDWFQGLSAGQSHRILLAFEGQYCMAVLLGENLDTLRLANFDVITQIL